MSANNRAQLINKLYKVAKKHYLPVTAVSSRSVLEHILYGCCLENSRYVAADEAFARMQDGFFDWNAVRVTTTSELAESLKGLANPEAAAVVVKKALHGIFETYYNFDLEFLKKENLKKTVQQFEKFRGVSSFVVNYAVQIALGGHSIPIDAATMRLMYVVGIVSEVEAEKGRVPGLERAIAKSKGIEFASVVHQLAAEFYKAPTNKDVRAIILSIASDAQDRFPKRRSRQKKLVDSAGTTATEPKTNETKVKVTKPSRKTVKSTDQSKPDKETAKKEPARKKGTKKAAVKKKATSKKKAVTRKTATPKNEARKKATRKKATRKKGTVAKATSSRKKSDSRSLTKKKPR